MNLDDRKSITFTAPPDLKLNLLDPGLPAKLTGGTSACSDLLEVEGTSDFAWRTLRITKDTTA